MSQLQAGYFFDQIFDLYKDFSYKTKIEKLTKELSFFECETSFSILQKTNDSFLAVANNLITRGLPTRPSAFLNEKFFEHLKIEFSLIAENLFRALHIIEPRLNRKNQAVRYAENTENNPVLSKNEVNFWYNILLDNFGDKYFQLLEPKPNISEILTFAEVNTEKFEKNISQIEIDFLFSIPYHIENQPLNIAIKIDESKNIPDENTENFRKEFFANLKWANLFSIASENFYTLNSEDLQPLSEFTFNEFFDILTKNFESPLFLSSQGREALQWSLSPFAIARIQKVFIEFLISKNISFDVENQAFNIAVIERDVPCAALAFQDLKIWFEKLWESANVQKFFPQINLTIFNTSEFAKCDLNNFNIIKHLQNFDSDEIFDLLIDISVLQRKFVFDTFAKTAAKGKVKIRSSYRIHSFRKFADAPNIAYSQVSENQRVAMEYLLKSIFQIPTFNDTQWNILNKILISQSFCATNVSLQDKAVSCLFAAMLQPSTVLTILPYHLAIQEHIRDLKNQKIDSFAIFSENWKPKFLRGKEYQKLLNNEAAFVFITPQVFQNQEFREILEKKNSSFSFAILDNIQRLSPWSYDFHFFYANVVKNVRNLCKISNFNELPIFAFSLPHNENVKVDISQELKISSFQMLEFQFLSLNLSFQMFETSNKTEKITQILSEKLNSLQKKKVLIVTKSEKNVKEIYEKLKNVFSEWKMSMFFGNFESEISNLKAIESEENYHSWREGETSLLIASFSMDLSLYSVADAIIFCEIPATKESWFAFNRAAKNHSKIFLLLDNQIVTETFFETQKRNIEKLCNGFVNEKVKNAEIIKQLIFKEFGEKVEFLPYPSENPQQLFLNKENKTFGSLDFSKNVLKNEYSNFDKSLTIKLLEFTKEKIEEQKQNKVSVFEWLENYTESIEIQGFTEVFEKLSLHEKLTFEVPYEKSLFETMLTFSKIFEDISVNEKNWKIKFSVSKNENCNFRELLEKSFSQKIEIFESKKVEKEKLFEFCRKKFTSLSSSVVDFENSLFVDYQTLEEQLKNLKIYSDWLKKFKTQFLYGYTGKN